LRIHQELKTKKVDALRLSTLYLTTVILSFIVLLFLFSSKEPTQREYSNAVNNHAELLPITT